MRLLLTALTCPKGQVASNLADHVRLLAGGRASGCDLVLLPEMSLTGYDAGAGISLDADPVRALVAATSGGPSLSFGLVERDETPGSTKPFITQVLATDGRIVTVHRKAGLPPDEEEHFARGQGSEPGVLTGTVTSFAVCAEIGTRPPYAGGATLVLGPAAPGLYGERRRTEADWRRGFDWWRGSVLADAARLLGPHRWLAVSTQAGATRDEDFPGWAALVGPGGTVVAELPDWRPGTLVVDLPDGAAAGGPGLATMRP